MGLDWIFAGYAPLAGVEYFFSSGGLATGTGMIGEYAGKFGSSGSFTSTEISCQHSDTVPLVSGPSFGKDKERRNTAGNTR